MPALAADRPRHGRGVSLIELMVGLTILAFSLGLMAPSFTDWWRNARVRQAAESIQGGLYQARSEAARRNAIVRFQLVSTLDNQCALSTSGPHWLNNLAITSSPAGACGQALSDTSSPYLLQRSAPRSTADHTTVSANRSLLGFDGLGRLNSLNDSTAITAYVVDVGSSDATCQHAGGTVQCLRVIVQPGGQISLCAPSHTDSSDPLTCPSLSG